jgi:anti-sigma factor RsiW
MKCLEFETLLADYLDGTLASQDRATFEDHAARCAACRSFLADAAAGAAFVRRAEPVLPPDELLTRIAHQAPSGRVQQPWRRQSSIGKLLARWLQPFLQPRLVMGMAMTVLSFAMLERCTGIRVQHIEASDLNPVRIWTGAEEKAIRVKDRVVKYYDNLRFVYQIESRLSELQEQASEEQTPQSGGKESGLTKTEPQPSGSGSNGRTK